MEGDGSMAETDEGEVARLRGLMAESQASEEAKMKAALAKAQESGPVTPSSTEGGQYLPRLDDVIKESELMRKRYEERIRRQTDSLTALVAKYNAVIAVCEEIIANETAGDLGDEYLEKLEAAKRTGDDESGGQTT